MPNFVRHLLAEPELHPPESPTPGRFPLSRQGQWGHVGQEGFDIIRDGFVKGAKAVQLFGSELLGLGPCGNEGEQ